MYIMNNEVVPLSSGEAENFDLKLAIDCARSFSESVQIGCDITDTKGKLLYEAGYGCASCEVCLTLGRERENCTKAHIYGMTESERFGGKYIYFCPMGLSYFVSPIVGPYGSAAKITVGPFLMVDSEDYIAYDLKERMKLSRADIKKLGPVLDKIPYVPPKKVSAMSNLLFMAVGFLNNVAAENNMLEAQSMGMLQGQINAYILELKRQDDVLKYPLDTERALVMSITNFDKQKAQELLNELLGFVLFSYGGDLSYIKTRIYELLVVISRAAIDAGASPESSYKLNHEFITRSMSINSIDKLCFLLSDVLNQYINSIFQFVDIKHIDVIHKAIDYITHNYDKKITLDEVAGKVFLSTSYFSKIFKQEMGRNFNAYLNEVRIKESKKLLMNNLKLVEVAALVGFEDQSYFTKVFKRITGVSPNRYRETGGRV